MAVRPSTAGDTDLRGPHNHKWLIFCHESMQGAADKVKELMGENAELASLKWDRFKDGFPNLCIKKEDALRLESYYGTALLVSFHTPEVIFEQLALLYALPRMRAKNIRIILPWFSTGTMERVETIGQIATAATMARMFTACPLGPTGPATCVIYDIHALQEQFYFGDQILVELKSAMSLLVEKLEAIKKENPNEKVSIVFPDDGAAKRFKAKFQGFDMIVCAKVREGDVRKVRINEGEANGSHCVMVDDLVQTGGTLLECAGALREQKAAKISCFVTHGIFPQESWKKFLNANIHKFWITDSVPLTAKVVNGQGPFEVLSLAPLISQYLQGTLQD